MPPAIPLRQEKKGSITHIASGQTFRDEHKKVFLELRDGRVFEGLSFGADKSVSGELVFQTGMVGYPESVTTFIWLATMVFLQERLSMSFWIIFLDISSLTGSTLQD